MGTHGKNYLRLKFLLAALATIGVPYVSSPCEPPPWKFTFVSYRVCAADARSVCDSYVSCRQLTWLVTNAVRYNFIHFINRNCRFGINTAVVPAPIKNFLSRVSILTRDIDIANLFVCPSVRLSVTFRYQMKTTVFFTELFYFYQHQTLYHKIPTGSSSAGR